MCGLLEFSISELLHHQYLRLQIAVREMEPVEIVGVVLVRGWERELAITVHVDDVFGAGGGGLDERVQALDGLKTGPRWCKVSV